VAVRRVALLGACGARQREDEADGDEHSERAEPSREPPGDP
jgi:hypothetical protein